MLCGVGSGGGEGGGEGRGREAGRGARRGGRGGRNYLDFSDVSLCLEGQQAVEWCVCVCVWGGDTEKGEVRGQCTLCSRLSF